MALREEFLDEMSVPLAAFGVSKVQELPNREVPGMRRHKVKETGFDLGITEGSKCCELVWLDRHESHPEDRRHQFFAVSNAPQMVRILASCIDLKAGACLL